MRQKGGPFGDGRQKGPGNQAQGVQVQLIQGQPLIKTPAGAEQGSNDPEVLQRVEGTGAVPGRMKEVGHDHIKFMLSNHLYGLIKK